MGLIKTTSTNPLSTVAVVPSGFSGSGASNTYEFTIPAATPTTVSIPIETESFPAMYAIVYQDTSGSSLGGSGVIAAYGNSILGGTTANNLILNNSNPSVGQIGVSRSGGSLVFAVNTTSGKTVAATVRVTKIA
jgi:hypothetical protein